MSYQRSENIDRLTVADTELFGRIAYAMIVVGLWQKTVRRTEESFDFFEITGQKGQMSYRIGRMSDGTYILFNLMTGARKSGVNLRELLSAVAYVPRTS